MGVRTYLEEELAKAKEKPKLRKVNQYSLIRNNMKERLISVDLISFAINI